MRYFHNCSLLRHFVVEFVNTSDERGESEKQVISGINASIVCLYHMHNTYGTFQKFRTIDYMIMRSE
jgi:phosphopantetheine adenylyltransferase